MANVTTNVAPIIPTWEQLLIVWDGTSASWDSVRIYDYIINATENITKVENFNTSFKKYVSETLTTSESYTNKSTYLRDFSSNISITSTNKKEVLKSFLENLNIAELKELARIVNFLESFNITDSIVKSEEKILSSNINVTEMSKKEVLKSFLENLNIVELKILDRVINFLESFNITDSVAKSEEKIFSSNISITSTNKKEVLKSFLENLNVTELRILDRIVNFLESFNIVENFHKEYQAIRNISEVINTQDSVVKDSTKSILQSLNIIDTQSKSSYKNIMEDFSLLDEYSRVYQAIKDISEVISFQENSTKDFTKGINQSVNIADNSSHSFLKKLSEVANFQDDLSREFISYRDFSENISLLDSSNNRVNKSLNDFIFIVEKGKKDFDKNTGEFIVINRDGNTITNYDREYTENISAVEDYNKNLIKMINRNLLINDYFIHPTPQTVISDIAIWEEFNSDFWGKQGLDIKPVNFTDWELFKEGDKEYKSATTRLFVELAPIRNIANSVSLSQFIFYSDGYDKVIKKVTSSVTDNPDGTEISFNSVEFNEPPDVLILNFSPSISGFSMPVITEVTASYFKCKIVDANNTPISGTITWRAQGY